MVAVYFVYLIIKTAITFVAANWLAILIVTVVVAPPILTVLIVRAIRASRATRLSQQFADLIDHSLTIADYSEATWEVISSLHARLGKVAASMADYSASVYRRVVSYIVDDGVVDSAELQRLVMVEHALGIEPADVASNRHDGFCDVFHHAVSDGLLTEQEEASLRQIAEALQVDPATIKPEMGLVEQLSEARRIRESPLDALPTIQTPLRLQQDERCLFATSATEMKRRIQHGQVSFEASESGELLVTSNRLLFSSSGMLALKLPTILQGDVVTAERLLSISKDGRQTPYFFKVEKPYIALEYLHRSMSRSA